MCTRCTCRGCAIATGAVASSHSTNGPRRTDAERLRNADEAWQVLRTATVLLCWR